ncbi:MAG: hypothetical protein KGY99_11560 [Phycisphaerae bacterium]|nr:hypothetical protein [Phycisphaerae bacterium]
MNLLKRLIPFLIPILLLTGCVRTIYVPHGTPVRLRETVEDVKVWVKDANGEPVAGRMDLYEGWFALPVDDKDETRPGAR